MVAGSSLAEAFYFQVQDLIQTTRRGVYLWSITNPKAWVRLSVHLRVSGESDLRGLRYQQKTRSLFATDLQQRDKYQLTRK
jgi:hypothetical protein